MQKTDQKPKYWMSLEQWADDKTFQKLAGDREFLNPLPVPNHKLANHKPANHKLANQEAGLWERREFLQLMTAGVALASFGCVRRPTEKNCALCPKAR